MHDERTVRCVMFDECCFSISVTHFEMGLMLSAPRKAFMRNYFTEFELNKWQIGYIRFLWHLF